MESPEDALRIAHAAETEGDLILAESTLKSASKRWKREPEFKMRHGRVLRKLGRNKKALKVFRSVLKNHPQRSDAAQSSAELAQDLGKNRLAEALWGRALAVGAPNDVATVGLCKAIWARGRKEDAWSQALQSFIQNGRSSKILHNFLLECSPIIGTSVPELDQFDTASFGADESNRGSDVRTGSKLVSANFGSDSVESMAGIQLDDTSTPSISDFSELLGVEETKSKSIDLSMVRGKSHSKDGSNEVEIPDDILDF
ncbi:MAG: tetratricopeptide repeat protein [Candidatus Thalassarchaeaceae archaeon]|jgi:tetratricopeptide (TPR) repeat protein|nr:tetratricopeptide repeat protein [Candidatus Thalassarchaeaceae archaeon]